MRFVVYLGVAVASLWGADLVLAQKNRSTSPDATAQSQTPIGHRQPKAKDVPPDRTSEETVKPEDRALDKALKGICRGC